METKLKVKLNTARLAKEILVYLTGEKTARIIKITLSPPIWSYVRFMTIHHPHAILPFFINFATLHWRNCIITWNDKWLALNRKPSLFSEARSSGTVLIVAVYFHMHLKYFCEKILQPLYLDQISHHPYHYIIFSTM